MSGSAIARRPMGLTSWLGRRPFGTLQREIDGLLQRFESDWDGELSAGEGMPSLDLAEANGEFEIKLDVPGLKAEEIDIEVSGNSVRISGHHEEQEEEQGRTYHRIERRSGMFSRAVTLPCEVDRDRVSAECCGGVLTVNLPKCEEAISKKIAVKG